MNEDTKAVVIDKERTDLERISESFGEQSKQYFRDILVITKVKKIWAKKEDMKPMSLYEAVAYVIACRDLWLNPMLNHVIMLEDNFYITLQWHLQNAHNSGTLKSMKNVKQDSPEKVENRPTFRYECTVEKMDGSQYNAIGYADSKTVKGAQYKTDLFLEQMAEARAMRRCLSRAFPVGMSSFEDTIDNPDFDNKQIWPSEEEKETKAKSIKDKYKKPEVIEIEVNHGIEWETFYTYTTRYLDFHENPSLEWLKAWMISNVPSEKYDALVDYYSVNYPEEKVKKDFEIQQEADIKAKSEVVEEKKKSDIMDKQKVSQDPQFKEIFDEEESLENNCIVQHAKKEKEEVISDDDIPDVEIIEKDLLSEKQLKDKRSILRVKYQTAMQMLRENPENQAAKDRQTETNEQILEINKQLMARFWNKD